MTVDLGHEGSSSSLAKDVLAYSIALKYPSRSKTISNEQDWRTAYPSYFLQHTKLALEHRRDAVDFSQRALDRIYSTCRFIRDPSEDSNLPFNVSFDKYFTSPTDKFVAHEFRGLSKEIVHPYDISIPYKNQNLTGIKLLDQLNTWISAGTVEPEAAEAVAQVIASGGSSIATALSDRVFVMLGAASAMGPLQCLLELGATVIAVDLHDRPRLWHKILQSLKCAPTSARLIVPIRKDKYRSGLTTAEVTALAGCDLLCDAPEIAAWIVKDICSTIGNVTIGNYVYGDGSMFVKLSLACDALMSCVVHKRQPGTTTLAFLNSPMDVFAVSNETREFSDRLYEYWSSDSLWQLPLKAASFGTIMHQNYDADTIIDDEGHQWNLVDTLVTQQGPNYALAKRIHQWRVIVSHSDIVPVSSNVAPPSATESVMHNDLIAKALTGSQVFPCLEVFEPLTSRWLMTLLLIHDLVDTGRISHPYAVFAHNACHGGMWRCPFKVASITTISYLINLADLNKTSITGVGLAIGTLGTIRALM